VDLQTGELQLFDKGGISELIRKNGFNTLGRNMLNDVTNRVQSSSSLKQGKYNCSVKSSTQTEIKTICKQLEWNQQEEQLNVNQEILNMDFNLERKPSLQSKMHDKSNLP
jgi:hypothetical protein